jgi:hypothetical protein
LSSRPLAVEALQYLAKHQIPDDDLVGAEDRPQAFDVGYVAAIEEVDLDAAVDDDHPVPRPLRLRARLHPKLQRKRLAYESVGRNPTLFGRAICDFSRSDFLRFGAPPRHYSARRSSAIVALAAVSSKGRKSNGPGFL